MRRSTLVFVLLLPGCGADSVEPACMTVQKIDAGICRVFPTGLVLHDDFTNLNASFLREDGTLELVTVLPGSLDCRFAVEHDLERGKLWWVEDPYYDDDPTPSLHQFDLATATEDWQRELLYPGYSFEGWSANLLAHEGALYLGAYLDLDAGEGLEGHSLLERLDATGEPVWTQIGTYPAYAFHPEAPSQPLEGIRNLTGTSTAIAFLGYVAGIDSAAITGAGVDPQTGELLWSTGVDSDDYSRVDLMNGDGESLYVLTGSPYAAQADIRALTPLGEERWRIDELVWPKFVDADFTQAVVGDELVHVVAGSNGPGTGARARVTRRQTSDGSLVCGSDLPELAELVPEFIDAGNEVWIDAWSVGDRLVLEVDVYVDQADPAYEVRAHLLLRPVE